MPQIKTAEASLRERFLDFADELLTTFWPEMRGRTVKEAQLGLPAERPDPVDYV